MANKYSIDVTPPYYAPPRTERGAGEERYVRWEDVEYDIASRSPFFQACIDAFRIEDDYLDDPLSEEDKLAIYSAKEAHNADVQRERALHLKRGLSALAAMVERAKKSALLDPDEVPSIEDLRTMRDLISSDIREFMKDEEDDRTIGLF